VSLRGPVARLQIVRCPESLAAPLFYKAFRLENQKEHHAIRRDFTLP
jgi:hypothetical protein